MLCAAIPTQATLTSFEPSGETTLDRKVALQMVHRVAAATRAHRSNERPTKRDERLHTRQSLRLVTLRVDSRDPLLFRGRTVWKTILRLPRSPRTIFREFRRSILRPRRNRDDPSRNFRPSFDLDLLTSVDSLKDSCRLHLYGTFNPT